MDDNPHPIKSSTEVNSFDTNVPQILQNAALVSSWAPLFKNSQCNIPPSIAEHPSPGWFCFCKFNSDFTISTTSFIGIEQPGYGHANFHMSAGVYQVVSGRGQEAMDPSSGKAGLPVREIFKFHRES